LNILFDRQWGKDMNAEIVKLGKPFISGDGTQARFIAHTRDGQSFDCVIPVEELEEAVQSLAKLIISARMNQSRENAGTPAPAEWEEQPIPVFVDQFYTGRNTDTGGLVLRVVPVKGPTVDVLFQPFHYEALRGMVLDEPPIDPAPGTH
jgi:hypothetical protein